MFNAGVTLADDQLVYGFPAKSDGQGNSIHTIVSKVSRNGEIVDSAKWEVKTSSQVAVCDYAAAEQKADGCSSFTLSRSMHEDSRVNHFLGLRFEIGSLQLIDFKGEAPPESEGEIWATLLSDYFPSSNWDLYFSLDLDPFYEKIRTRENGVAEYRPRPGLSADHHETHEPFEGSVDDGIVYLVNDATGQKIANFGCDHYCFGVLEVHNRFVEFRFDKKLIAAAGLHITQLKRKLVDMTVLAETPKWASNNEVNTKP